MSNTENFVLDENVLTKYTGSDAVVEIPEGVTVIGSSAFNGNKTMTDLIMPDSVVTIGEHAFERCVKLKNVTFSQNLEEIKFAGFADCKALKEVHLPDSLRYLGGGTFAGCAKLQTVTCNSKVFEMGSNPFSDFHQPASKQLADENGLIIFCGILYEAVEHKSELVIPQGVTKIANGIFRKNTWERKEPLKKVVLPDTVTYIGSAAFAGRSELEEINLFPGITLGENVFSGCNKLADEHGFLVIDGTAVAYYGDGGEVNVPEGITELKNNLFACRFEANPGNPKIHTVNLPESLRKIGSGAFTNCKNLENIRIPAGVEEIGSMAFQDCISLQDSHIADHVPKLGEGVFIGCKKMADENGFVIAGGAVQAFFGADREIVIPEGVTAIESGTFCKTGILSISLPSTLRRLGMAVFQNCNMLESIRIPEGVTEIKADTFENCERLREVVLPSTLASIGRDAFSGCEDLAQIQIPDTVTEIGAGAFTNCKSLKEIRIPDGIKSVKYDMFAGCVALEQVTLPQGLETIELQAFRGCAGLKKMILPASLKELKFHSFWMCTGLEKLECPAQKLEIDPKAFEGCDRLADENGMLILANTLWRYTGQGGHVTVPEGVTTLANDVFREGSKGMGRGRSYHRRIGSLTGVTLPSTLREIGAGAFAGCSALQQVEIPAGVVFVGQEAFENCKALTSVSLPAGLAGMGEGAFRGCESLTRMQLPEGTEYINGEYFKDCTKLTEVTIPATVTRMGENVFRGCSSLQTITVHTENPVFSSKEGILYNKAGDELLYYPAGKNPVTTSIEEKVTTIGRGAFVDCNSLKKVIIPAHIACVGDEAFPRKGWGANAVKRVIEVAPGAGSGGVGENVFDIDEWDNPLVYPKLPVTFVKEQTTQVCLGLGFCMNPDQYEGEYRTIYEKYALSHQKTLLKKATAMKLTAVKDYFSKIADDNPVSGKVKKVNYKKLSDTAKVELLERVILERDVVQLKAVLEGCKTFELTARALGIACCYGTPEIVRILVEFGANFVFEVTPALKRKYGVAYGTTYSSYKADYDLMVAKTNANPYITTLYADSNSYHFGVLPAIDGKPMEQTQQAEIAAYLLEKNCEGFQASHVLYCAILWGNRPVAETLLAKGVKLPAWAEVVLADPSPEGWGVERSELLASLPALPVSECVYALTTFSNCLKEKNLKIQLTQKAFENNSKTFGDARVLKCILELTDTTKLTKSKLLEAAVEKDDVETLEIMVTSGWLKTAAQREKLISYAAEQKKTAALAWLIDYKNRTVDVAAEAAKKEAKMMRELTEDPNSVSALKKIWGYKKLENGTLEITGYKGDGGDVVIPAMIGKSKVTSIAEDAFSASDMNGRIKNRDARKKITSVVIPEGVTSIGRAAFLYCESLHTVTVPETLTHIGTVAFRYCKALRNINLPAGIKSLGRGIFWDCPNLYDNRGYTVINGILLDCVGDRTEVKIPEGVTRIGAEVFKINASWDKKNSIRSVVLPESLEVIEESAFEGMKNLHAIVIPSGVRTIGKKAFYGTGLESITFNSGLQTIGEGAFSNTPLVAVKLPATVTDIGMEAFKSCGKLRDLYIPGGKVNLGKEILGTYDTGSAWGRPSGVYVHTPADSGVATYMQQYSGVFVDSENLE